MARPPRIPVRLPSGQDVTYFVTICVQNRKKVLDNNQAFELIKSFCASSKKWRTISAIVMPDHLHALIQPVKDRDERPNSFSAGLKRVAKGRGWRWQTGVFDRLLRSNEFIDGKWHYMRENPVRAGLVRYWKDWPFRIDCELQGGDFRRRSLQIGRQNGGPTVSLGVD